MALWLPPPPISDPTPFYFPNPTTTFPSHSYHNHYITYKPLSPHRYHRRSHIFSAGDQNLTTSSPPASSFASSSPRLPSTILQFTTSAILFLGFGVRACSAASTQFPIVPAVADSQALQEQRSIQDSDDDLGKSENVKLKAAFESWKSKTYALTVPLRIVALRGSLPPSWVKEFMQSQGRRVKLRSEFRASLENIYSDMSMHFSKGKVDPKSAVAADLITVGDSWLSFAIKNSVIDPIQGVDDQDWFTNLGDKWKVFLRRNGEGELDSEGKIWAAPYRWGSMVIAYKKNKFQKHKLAPIEDWADLWRPELAGRISMVDSPREVVGTVLKYMGASYNTENIDLQVTGGRNAVQKNLALLEKQVRLFDSMHYLKAFGVGDVWVAVGWSSDVLPAAKRMSDVAVVVPKSGGSLWADMWAIPAASRYETNRIGGRVRGPSPLVHQWIEFCLQDARALPFKQEVIPGASPSALEKASLKVPENYTKGKPKLDTNLIAGVPPPEILDGCEFLEPLSDASLSDYKWLIDSMDKSNHGLVHMIQHLLSSSVKKVSMKLHSKIT